MYLYLYYNCTIFVFVFTLNDKQWAATGQLNYQIRPVGQLGLFEFSRGLNELNIKWLLYKLYKIRIQKQIHLQIQEDSRGPNELNIKTLQATL